MISEIDDETKCFSCGKEATIRLTVEPDGDSLYLCDDLDCKEDALLQLDDANFDYQGKSSEQAGYGEVIGAISIIVMIVIITSVFVYKLLSL
jgi:hypothetical protein